jgi:hypothetical protein
VSIGHDPVWDWFGAARELEPREDEISAALTLAMSAPPRSSLMARTGNVVSVVGAILALIVAFAVVEFRDLGAHVAKKHHGTAGLVATERRDGAAINAAAVVRALQELQTRKRPGAPSRLSGVHGAPETAAMRVPRHAPSRRVRCACDGRPMRPPPRPVAGPLSRAGG